MELKLYNSLSNKIETFVPLDSNKVSMYVCGSTVYDSPHIGNLRPIVAFDILRRLLIELGYEVTYVSNFTDVDDKIINRALKEGVDEMTIANRYIDEIRQLVKDINSLKPTFTPRVTEYIEKIISYIKKLVDTNHAYVIDGDVYFKVNSVNNYGQLANINIEDLKVGARVDEDIKKQSPLDFALWKKTDVGINWPSPWGNGRPGWHTECCVMIDSIFPQGFIDIHGGGFDLKFPHHENEIAQNKASNNNSLARYWIHNGFVTFDNDKMSKSLGNVILARDAIKQYGGNLLRLVLLSSHYRAPVKYNNETITMASNELKSMETTYSQLAVKLQLNKVDLNDHINVDIEPFISSLCDDMNVSNALTYLFTELKTTNNLLRNSKSDVSLLAKQFFMISKMFNLLGLNIKFPVLTKEDFSLFDKYQKARDNRDFVNSDLIRKKLIEKKLL